MGTSFDTFKTFMFADERGLSCMINAEYGKRIIIQQKLSGELIITQKTVQNNEKHVLHTEDMERKRFEQFDLYYENEHYFGMKAARGMQFRLIQQGGVVLLKYEKHTKSLL